MKKLITHFFTLALISTLVSCAGTSNRQQEYMEAATLWQQTAAEYRALSYQAYNIARTQLPLQMKKARKKKPAIVLDLDETVLDNSPYQGMTILEDQAFTPKTWDEWVDLGSAQALPGAVEFLKYAQSLGVEIFYISNRVSPQLDITYQNMVELGIPVKRENMYLRTTTSGKKDRRERVRDQGFEIVMLMGDVLADFHEVFESYNLNERRVLTEKFSQEFGRSYIVFPNTMYGDWESAVYGGSRDLSPAQKSSLRRKALYRY